ncbi:MAG: hypothetical protein OHK0052_22800 [Anaerolineales bacterium]
MTPAPNTEFCLLESFRWSAQSGFFLLHEHLHRLNTAAQHFGFPFDPCRIYTACQQQHQTLRRAAALTANSAIRKVRLLLHPSGSLTWTDEPLTPSSPSHHMRVTLAAQPIHSENRLLQYKTTQRDIYQQAQAQRPGFDDLLLYNQRGELTESLTANLVIVRGGARLTPPTSSGLLPGTFRSHLLQHGILRESLLYPQDLHTAEKIYLINSVRLWRVAQFFPANTAPGL